MKNVTEKKVHILHSLQVDGQQFAYGDADDTFCLQSCSNPFMYCAACEELGIENVHCYVGREPSGKEFNAFTLSRDNRPHNPMINAGAIITHGLVHQNQK
jgi:glutaminase